MRQNDLQYIETHCNQGMVLGLSRMQALMAQLGHMENRTPVIHVAGTNGKGSVCTFLASVLKEAGLRTGRYQSPAVFDPMEIIQINGINISEEAYEKLAGRIAAVMRSWEAEKKLQPTLFEIQTAIAYLFFAEEQCDAAVIETGLGGDQDATNVTSATVASVFTPISLDHTRILGETLPEIAGHKAGILKPGALAVTAPQQPEVLEVLRSRAQQLGQTLLVADQPVSPGSGWLQTETYGRLLLGLDGSYQPGNAALAVRVLEALRQRNLLGLGRLTDEEWTQAVTEGLSKARLPGRMECIGKSPRMLLDGAHNPGAAAALSEALETKFAGVSRIFIMGAFADKDYLSVARTVIRKECGVLTVRAPGPRGLDPERLLTQISGFCSHCQGAYESVTDAVEEAVRLAKRQQQETGAAPLIVAFGSLSWLAEAKRAYLKIAAGNEETE